MKITKRWWRWLLAASASAGALGVYTTLIEPRWLQVTHNRVYLRGLHSDLEGLRIALLSDLHGGWTTPLALVRRACCLAMAEAPDLVALTGDFADAAADSRAVLNVLAGLQAPLGVYAVPGNHDYNMGIATWHRQVAATSQIVDLTNRAVIKRRHGARLCIAGVDAFHKGRPRLDALPPSDQVDCTILLAHNPDQAEHLARAAERVDLVLSGHTHGGQVRLPWIGALRNPAHHADLYEAGLRARPWAKVYVSRGVGMVGLPIRFLSRPELAILELARPPVHAAHSRDR
jgi:predicted MPP superfamily phosphohydrolase